MELYLTVLSYLAKNDNGEFIDITLLHQDLKFLKEKCHELSKLEMTQTKSPGVYSFGDIKGNSTTIGDLSELKKIKARILLPGHDYLRKNMKELPNQRKKSIPTEKKLKYLDELIYEVVGWIGYSGSTVTNFIVRAKEIIARIDGPESSFINDVDIFHNGKNRGSEVIVDWHEQIHTTLLRLRFRIETDEEVISSAEKTSIKTKYPKNCGKNIYQPCDKRS